MARTMLALAAVLGFLISAVTGCFWVPLMRKLHCGQTIKTKDGPSWHARKNGTPTMGGVCFIIGSLVSLGIVFITLILHMPELFGTNQDMNLILCIFSAAAFGAVGFIDDFIKVILKRNLGLRAWQKLVLQTAIAMALLLGLYKNGAISTLVRLPIFGTVNFGILFYPLSMLLILFMVNAVNLTDGIDGLASSVTFVVMLGYLVATSLMGYYHLSVYAAALAGALAGFLIWNFYPAKTFMGDTGSMFLGGAVVGMAYCMGWPELLLFMGAVYIWEAGSVVIQVTYFKITHGKRIFKMTPIHHSFEKSGWSEVKIDSVFSLVALAFVALGFVYIRMI